MGGSHIQSAEGGVHFSGSLGTCYRANLESRVASRILWRVGGAPYSTEADIYEFVHGLPWIDWFEGNLTLRVDVAAIRCPLPSLDFITLRIKDAVCDRFRAATGQRPNVDTRTPDVRIHGFLDEKNLTVYLDTSGDALFKRGLRKSVVEAPLRENLAAGILRLAGWSPGIPLLDPMCGGGTFLVEAAQMALGIAPGAGRSFAFQRLKNFDARQWNKLIQENSAGRRPATALPIFGSDLYGSVLDLARDNLAAAGLEDVVSLKQANVLEISPPAPEGILVTNPPYGVRIGEQKELAEFYPKLGDALKQKFAGWRAYIFTADLRLPKLIRLTPSKRTPLYNGPLECRLYEFRMVAGSLRGGRKESA